MIKPNLAIRCKPGDVNSNPFYFNESLKTPGSNPPLKLLLLEKHHHLTSLSLLFLWYVLEVNAMLKCQIEVSWANRGEGSCARLHSDNGCVDDADG